MSNFERRERRFEPQLEVKNQTDTTDKKDKTDPIEPNRERLKDFLNAVASELRKEDIPYKDRGEMRINMYSRENISKENIEKDEEEAKRLRKQFHEKLVAKLMEKHKLKREEAEKRAREIEIAGENLEILKTAIFYKHLRKDFIIARSTDYDDTKRHVDNIILDKKTSNIVCALDETTDLDNVREKEGEVFDINESGGASLKYGLEYEQEVIKSPNRRDVRDTVKVREIPNIPLFYLPLPYNLVKEGMSDFKTDLENISGTEYKIYKYFVELMGREITNFPATNNNQNARTKLSNFFRDSFPKFQNKL